MSNLKATSGIQWSHWQVVFVVSESLIRERQPGFVLGTFIPILPSKLSKPLHCLHLLGAMSHRNYRIKMKNTALHSNDCKLMLQCWQDKRERPAIAIISTQVFWRVTAPQYIVIVLRLSRWPAVSDSIEHVSPGYLLLCTFIPIRLLSRSVLCVKKSVLSCSVVHVLPANHCFGWMLVTYISLHSSSFLLLDWAMG